MIKRRPLLQNFSALGIGCLLLGALSGHVLAGSDDGPGPQSREPLLRPMKVVSMSGNVQNAEALVEGGCTTLSWRGQGTAPQVILDYGRDVGGLPVFDIIAISGTPQLQAIYSEAQKYLLPSGDASAPTTSGSGQTFAGEVSFVGNASGADLSRVDTYPVSHTGLIANRLLQGGERFQALTLTAPGSVTLRGVGILSKTFQLPPKGNRGSFTCSDPALNEIWDLGAYTLRLGQVSSHSLPTTWTATFEGVDVPGSEYTSYQAGAYWTDYTAAFEVKVIANEASWLVHSQPNSGYRFVLAADNDALGGTPNTLRAFEQSSKTPLGQAAVPDFKPGTWHAVKTVVAGTVVSAYLDGQLVLSFDVQAVAPTAIQALGSVGFGNVQGAEALFRNLSVTAGGQILYASTLTNPSVLDDFAAGTNSLPVILDGAKRDRYLFSGDVGISGLTVYYSNGASDCVRGSLRLLGSYQLPNGEVFGDMPAQLIPGFSPTSVPFNYIFTLPYSIYFVTILDNYYLYTGDQAFVKEEWPVVQKEIAFLRSTTNAQHLIVATGFQGIDWHPQDGKILTGEVTEFNAHYYGALRGAARLARATGHEDVAADYEAEAALVKNAINGQLFNAQKVLYDISDQLRGQVVAQDANAFAVLLGVAPSDQQVSILQHLNAALSTPNGPLAFSQGSGFSQVISPFASSWEVLACFEAGDTSEALSLIRTVWGHMRKGSPFYSGAVWETLAPDATPAFGAGTSLAHGWSSGPTSGLSKYVLGVRPVKAGYKKWLVEPQPGDLTWAEGQVPTPFGPIKVNWKKSSDQFTLNLTVPDNTSGTVGVPLGGNQGSLVVNGRSVKGERKTSDVTSIGEIESRDGYVYLRDLAPGDYQIVATGTSK